MPTIEIAEEEYDSQHYDISLRAPPQINEISRGVRQVFDKYKLYTIESHFHFQCIESIEISAIMWQPLSIYLPLYNSKEVSDEKIDEMITLCQKSSSFTKEFINAEIILLQLFSSHINGDFEFKPYDVGRDNVLEAVIMEEKIEMAQSQLRASYETGISISTEFVVLAQIEQSWFISKERIKDNYQLQVKATAEEIIEIFSYFSIMHQDFMTDVVIMVNGTEWLSEEVNIAVQVSNTETVMSSNDLMMSLQQGHLECILIENIYNSIYCNIKESEISIAEITNELISLEEEYNTGVIVAEHKREIFESLRISASSMETTKIQIHLGQISEQCSTEILLTEAYNELSTLLANAPFNITTEMTTIFETFPQSYDLEKKMADHMMEVAFLVVNAPLCEIIDCTYFLEKAICEKLDIAIVDASKKTLKTQLNASREEAQNIVVRLMNASTECIQMDLNEAKFEDISTDSFFGQETFDHVTSTIIYNRVTTKLEEHVTVSEIFIDPATNLVSEILDDIMTVNDRIIDEISAKYQTELLNRVVCSKDSDIILNDVQPIKMSKKIPNLDFTETIHHDILEEIKFEVTSHMCLLHKDEIELAAIQIPRSRKVRLTVYFECSRIHIPITEEIFRSATFCCQPEHEKCCKILQQITYEYGRLNKF